MKLTFEPDVSSILTHKTYSTGGLCKECQLPILITKDHMFCEGNSYFHQSNCDFYRLLNGIEKAQILSALEN